MKTIETTISVNPDGSAVIELHLPGSVTAGVHRAVVIVDDKPAPVDLPDETACDLLPLTFNAWPNDCTFRREELYGDEGR